VATVPASPSPGKHPSSNLVVPFRRDGVCSQSFCHFVNNGRAPNASFSKETKELIQQVLRSFSSLSDYSFYLISQVRQSQLPLQMFAIVV
jgi:hypothetical protein